MQNVCSHDADGRNHPAPEHAYHDSSGTVPHGVTESPTSRSRSAQTLRAFGQRIPGAGDVLARSLDDAVNGPDGDDHRRLVGDRQGGRA